MCVDHSRINEIAGLSILLFCAAAAIADARVLPVEQAIASMFFTYTGSVWLTKGPKQHVRAYALQHVSHSSMPSAVHPDVRDIPRIHLHFRYSLATRNGYYSASPERVGSSDSSGTRSDALVRNPGYGFSIDTPASAPIASDDWRITASPRIGVTHSHEMGRLFLSGMTFEHRSKANVALSTGVPKSMF